MKDKCNFCKGKLIKEDPLNYWKLGFCSLSCMLLHMQLRIAMLESDFKSHLITK